MKCESLNQNPMSSSYYHDQYHLFIFLPHLCGPCFPRQTPDQHFFTFPSGYGQFALGVLTGDDRFDFGAGMGTEDNREAENRRERENASRQRYSARQPRSRHVSRRQPGRHEGVPTLEGSGLGLRKS